MKEKDVNNTSLSPLYSRLKFKDFEKSMKDLGFVGDYESAYKKIGGVIPKKKTKGVQ